MKLFATFFFSILSASILAQGKIEPSHYVFPKFELGVVRMKNGEAVRALLNYNAYSQEIVFDEAGVKKAVVEDQMKDIDTVYIKDRAFFKFNDTFVELLQRTPYHIYASYKCKVKPPERASAFGTTSQTSSNMTYSPTMSIGMIYDIKLPQGTKVTPETSYLLRKSGGLDRVKNLNQLTKLYPKKKKIAKDFVKKNDVDFHDPKAVVQLINFLETD